jgi:hypothetical protein
MYLGYLIESMDTRLNQRLIDVMPLEGLIPANLNMYDDKNIIKPAKIYVQDLYDDTSSTIRADLFIWRQQWSQNTIGLNTETKIIIIIINYILINIFKTIDTKMLELRLETWW